MQQNGEKKHRSRDDTDDKVEVTCLGLGIKFIFFYHFCAVVGVMSAIFASFGCLGMFFGSVWFLPP